MANNRIFIKCNICGEKLFLGKSFYDGFYYENYNDVPLEDSLNDFYNKHTFCNSDLSEGDFSIEYETPINKNKENKNERKYSN